VVSLSVEYRVAEQKNVSRELAENPAIGVATLNTCARVFGVEPMKVRRHRNLQTIGRIVDAVMDDCAHQIKERQWDTTGN
jgi:hypothetical protein